MRRYKTASKIMAECYNCEKQFDIDTLNQVIVQDQDKLVCNNCLRKFYTECNQCHKFFEKSQVQQIGNNNYCELCSEYMVECSVCNKDINHSDALYYQDEYYCKECYEQQFVKCDNCDTVIKKEDAVETYNEHDKQITLCKDCSEQYITYCDHCEKILHIYKDDIHYDYQQKPICNKCYTAFYTKCDLCENIFPNTLIHMDNQRKLLICEFCDTIDPQADNGQIYDHDAKIKLKFKKKLNEVETKEYIGVEIEIMAKDPYGLQQFIRHAKKNKNLIFKRDGSLDRVRGIEINSQPATYNYHLTGMKWQHIFSLMNEYDVNDTNGCGIHFHISKNNFTTDQLKVLDYFVNNCVSLLGAIGGRDYRDNKYAPARQKSEEEYGHNVFDRNQAVNFNNENTVQLRFPASTSNYSKFKKLLSMVHNLCKLTKIITFDQIKTMDQNQLKSLFIEAVKQ